jgi:hypothetical protein
MVVTDLLARSLENACKDVVSQVLKECGGMYNFDAEEAMRAVGLEKLMLQRKAMSKRVPNSVKRVSKGVKSVSKVCPLPFMSSLVDVNVCSGLSFNHGLFTQCNGAKMDNGVYCGKCQSQADKNASGKPDCGCVGDRMSLDFKDGKGRKPSHYAKVIAKLGFTVEQAREAASSKNVELDDSYFVVPEKVKSVKSAEKSEGKRGRPKKASAAVEASNVTDLFAQLTSDADDMSDITTSSAGAGKTKLSAEEKAEKKAALEADRANKKAALEALRIAKKAEVDAERANKKAALEAERLAKKAEAEAKKLAEKVEREAKRAAEKAKAQSEKESKSQTSSKKKSEAVVSAPAAVVSAPAVEAVSESAPKKVTVSIVTIDGVQYYRNKATNTIMDKNTQEYIGTYDEKNKKIIPFPDDGELDVEESEDEYEDEDA